ncbi:ShlB/FhaC/HecB family hemolysin secretion/activation protein [Aliikangiella coralliicola]|uniref:ShlB/FhaC/HecB family hemolysin secretion/activation protein n=1 Tax=Aliikangiella coralliicola TaxID=2592383 RepID=A0A545U8U0_9GAMM|nr:ShlB/FhaC/HecB family hemolysin secretion/activation protein [Aliikangiella coralliicola]TQV85890.1 ShlB/FhaC/HecB family hemolysin secretion/activation protein [Aliikangiella coralliicola]
MRVEFGSKTIIKNFLVLILFSAFSASVMAEFVKMPKIEELRKIKEKTLLRDMDIPGVRDRSPDPTAGPRLAVSEFRIQGLVEFPELGITHKALNDLMESIRFDLMGEGKLLESGYTIEELGELSDLLVEIEEETLDRHVTPLEVQQLVWLIRAQRGKRGVTLGQIEGVADSITRFYRERGFILAKAYIPKQEVRDGIVNLTLLLGMLGEVKVNGNDLYAVDTIQSVFDNLMSQPITNKSVEENLFIINSFPGINVDGYFEPGTQVGDTRLNINVKQENRYNANVRVDNHGTDESGLYRVFVDGQINNLFGSADSLNLSVLQAMSPENTTFGKLNFESNLFSSKFRLGIDLSQNQFIVDQSQVASNINLNGKVDVAGITGRYIAERSRKENSSYEIRYETIKSDLQIGDLPDIGNFLDEELTHLSATYHFDILDDVNKRLHEGSVKLISGKFDMGAATGQKESYQILFGEYSLLSFVKVPFTEIDSRLILRSNLQYSGTNLSALARFSLAGPTRTRGFSPSLFTADDALYLGADWIFKSPDLFDFNIGSTSFKDIVRPFVFIDYSYGLQYSLVEDESDTTGQLGDVGFGLQFSHADFSGNLQVGFPVLEDFSFTQEQPESDSVRVLFDFQYRF